MTFPECVIHCGGIPELVTEFNRLTGHQLATAASPIERMIDEATGAEEAGLRAFTAFVFECVWMPLHANERAA